ncbi:glycoside hydrolase family 5 protein, partial [Rhodococcus erythropolis]|nr:glycoside hydrolase family 5 protein [Rhodococcus erythropolis]
MRRIPLSALIVAGSLILGGGIAAAQGSLPTSGSAGGTDVPPSYLTDDAGRSLILRGFNTASSAKSAPDGMPKFTEADLEREHADMGTNFVRFLISWRSVEP